jgi:hypothetical protein
MNIFKKTVDEKLSARAVRELSARETQAVSGGTFVPFQIERPPNLPVRPK